MLFLLDFGERTFLFSSPSEHSFSGLNSSSDLSASEAATTFGFLPLFLGWTTPVFYIFGALCSSLATVTYSPSAGTDSGT